MIRHSLIALALLLSLSGPGEGQDAQTLIAEIRVVECTQDEAIDNG